MPAIHYETFRVRYYECDAYGHLNNTNYLRWMQEAAFAASSAVGYDFARYNEMGHCGWCVKPISSISLRWLMGMRFRSRPG